MMRSVRSYLRFVRAMIGLNLRAALEYRASFVTGVGFMAISDTMWIIFWSLFFARFPVVKGWELRDVATMWSIVAAGLGLAWGFFGNCRPIGVRVIAEGRLDYHLTVPKNVLLHYLLGSMGVPSLGDVFFGVLCFGLVVRPGPAEMLLFLVLSLNVCVIMVSMGVLANSLAFYAGNSEGLANQFSSAIINFSTYPFDLFSGGVKLVLFTAIPAGFVSYLPVRLLREWDLPSLLAVQGFSAAVALLAIAAFSRGLRRYESGNLVAMKI